MRNKSFFLLLLGLVAFTTSSLGQAQFDPVKSLKPKEWEDLKPAIYLDANAYVQDAEVYQINPVLIHNWYIRESDSIRLSIPGLPSYWVYRTNIFTPDFSVTTSDGKRFSGKEFTGIQYQARDKIVGLSVYQDHLTAVISANGTQYNFGPDPRDPKRYFLTNEKDLPNPIRCQVNDDSEPDDTDKDRQGKAAPEGAASVSCKLLNGYFEVDYHLFQQAGSVVAASNYTASVFNIVNRIYRVEKVAMKLGSVFVWTTPDPYAGFTNSQLVLLNFATNRPPTAQFHFQHLLSTRPTGMGGVAYTASVCTPNVNHAFSNIFFNYNQLPTYSWTIECVSHEIGHNLGSKHTHWCGWLHPDGTRRRIDSCANGEAYNGVVCPGGQKYKVGTIMSYCNQSYLHGIDFGLGFGPLPGDAIRSFVAAAPCVPSVASPYCDSLKPIAPPPPPVVINCSENLQHYVNASGKSCFKFKIKAGAIYRVDYCRYEGFTQGNPPMPGFTPSACSVRNNIVNYTPNAGELASGWIDRVAQDQPWITNRWYSVRVICESDTYLTFFWWP